MYKIVVTEYFKRQLKRLVKRNRALKKVFIGVLSTFKKETAIREGNRAVIESTFLLWKWKESSRRSAFMQKMKKRI